VERALAAEASDMTRSGQHASVIAKSLGFTLVLACVCSSAAVPPQGLPDLSKLEFAPSLPGAAPVGEPSAPVERDAPRPSSGRSGRTMVQLAESIAAEQANEGTFSPGLIYDMVSLASIYQELDDHVAAIAVLDRAKQIVRVNNGLSSLDQGEMLQHMIVSLEAMGRYGTAALQRNELLELARKHPSDLRVGSMFATVADGRFAAIERWMDADMATVPIIFGSGPGGRDDTFPTIIARVRGGMRAAQQNYGEALRATAANGSPRGPDVYEIENNLMKTYWMQMTHTGLFFGSDISKQQIRQSLDEIGARSYDRRVKYSQALMHPAKEIAGLLIELGDWHLLFGQDDKAIAAYGQAHATLMTAGISAEEIDGLFTPASPLLVPVFAPHWIDANAGLGYMGYVDVAVDLDTLGRSRDVRVTGQSALASDLIVKRLKKYIAKKNQFRPLFANGERLDNDDVALRYYFKY
jgi:hypothetical protein